MKSRSRRLLIGTQHPDFRGGVLTLCRAFLNWAREEPMVSTALAYTPLRRADELDLGIGSLIRGRWRPQVREERFEDLPAYCCGRVFSSLESLRIVGTRKLWQDLLDRYDLHQVVCGYALTGLPQALCGKRFVICAATSMDGDKRARLEKASFLRRVVHGLQVNRLRALERLVLEKAACVLAISPYTRLDLIEHGADPERTEIIRTPIDTDRFRPGLDHADHFTVMWTCRHNDPRKRTGDLIRAFAILAKKAPEARLALVGDGSSDAVNQLATELGIASQVAYLGRRPDAEMPSLYNRASVFAIPSDQEGLGIAGLEAMACAVPVVSTRCGGAEAFVIPEKTGILVDRGSIEQLADALIHLHQNGEERLRLGRQSRAFVEENYSVEQFAKQMRLVYSKVWPEAWGEHGSSKDSRLIGA